MEEASCQIGKIKEHYFITRSLPPVYFRSKQNWFANGKSKKRGVRLLKVSSNTVNSSKSWLNPPGRESQLISSNSTVTPTFLIFIYIYTFFILLCICSIHLQFPIFFILLYFSKAASFKKRHSEQRNRLDQVHFFKTIGVSLKKQGSFLLLYFMSHS